MSDRVSGQTALLGRSQKRFEAFVPRNMCERTDFDQRFERVPIPRRPEGGSDLLPLRPEDFEFGAGQNAVDELEAL